MGIDIRNISIFVEGDGDKVFIRDVLKIFYDIILDESKLRETVFVCNGYNNLQKHKDEFLKVQVGGKKEGGVNLVIFDADFNGREENHGFAEKCKYLDKTKQDLNISFQYFLLPNHELDGTLETLLETCILPKHQQLMDCWKELESCVSTGSYTVPADKSKIYFYLECLHGITNKEKEQIKDPKRDYTKSNLWSIDYINNNEVKKLKGFLDSYLY